jgi:hypothetical protein
MDETKWQLSLAAQLIDKLQIKKSCDETKEK